MQTHLRLLLAAAALGSIGALSLVLPLGSSAPVPTAGAAQVDYFLKIEGVDGESTDPGHRNEIEIESFSWGVTMPRDAATGMATGRRQHKPLTIKKTIDKASPLLARAAAMGDNMKKVVLTGRDPSGHEFEIASFFDVFVSDFMQNGDQGSRPMESLSLNFQKIEFSYIPKGADGKAGTPIVRGWDLAKGK